MAEREELLQDDAASLSEDAVPRTLVVTLAFIGNLNKHSNSYSSHLLFIMT